MLEEQSARESDVIIDPRKQPVSSLLSRKTRANGRLRATHKVTEKRKRSCPTKSNSSKEGTDAVEEFSNEELGSRQDSGSPPLAPQLKLDEDGNITLDENSLIVSTDITQKPEETVSTTYYKHRKVEHWTEEETALFYKGLKQFGADFSMVAQLFPKRDRKQVKAKFKREERISPEKIDLALSCRPTFTNSSDA
eukprot:jgi/Galph1/2438/GphlegSOOS_G1118.1